MRVAASCNDSRGEERLLDTARHGGVALLPDNGSNRRGNCKRLRQLDRYVGTGGEDAYDVSSCCAACDEVEI